MWGTIKMLGVAVAVGAGVGALLKSRVDSALKGGTPKKVHKSKLQIIEIPANVDVKEVKILVESTSDQE